MTSDERAGYYVGLSGRKGISVMLCKPNLQDNISEDCWKRGLLN